MNAEDFIEAIRLVVESHTIDAVQENLVDPPGRQPRKKDVELSKWFNNLSTNDQTFVRAVIEESVQHTIFSFLCVIDGVSAIEDSEEKGDLELYYVKNGIKTLLNDPPESILHDIYNVEE